MGVLDHHRAGEVFVEVVHVFTHPGDEAVMLVYNVPIRHCQHLKPGNKYNILLLPTVETRRHTDIVKQDQMLDELTETNSPSMRTNRNLGKKQNMCIVTIKTKHKYVTSRTPYITLRLLGLNSYPGTCGPSAAQPGFH